MTGFREQPDPLDDAWEYALLPTPEPYSAAGQQVTCKDCGRTYICTPSDDYWAKDGETVTCCTDGRCWVCLLAANGIDADKTPVTMMDSSGRILDPRDERG